MTIGKRRDEMKHSIKPTKEQRNPKRKKKGSRLWWKGASFLMGPGRSLLSLSWEMKNLNKTERQGEKKAVKWKERRRKLKRWEMQVLE